MLPTYTFRISHAAADRDQIEDLNYRTFVREIRQYADDGSGRLKDKFDDKNTYLVARYENRVVGMVAVHDRPPFSVEKRLPPTVRLHELGSHLMEVRMLAIESEHRNGVVFAGLLERMLRHAAARDCSHLLISGVQDQVALYRRVGFVELGPSVPEGATSFTPMIMAIGGLSEAAAATLHRLRRRISQ